MNEYEILFTLVTMLIDENEKLSEELIKCEKELLQHSKALDIACDDMEKIHRGNDKKGFRNLYLKLTEKKYE